LKPTINALFINFSNYKENIMSKGKCGSKGGGCGSKSGGKGSSNHKGPGGNWPSSTGNKSGSDRGNAPSKGGK
jgi:hypothetical protein